MKEILIVSGKGGTGKTTISACFAQLSTNAVFCDCDVDAANLHLLLAPRLLHQQEFYAGLIPVLDTKKCINCRICQKVCKFQALDEKNGVLQFSAGSCEGCGVCADNCPENAIEMQEKLCGALYSSQTNYGTLFHAELFPGEENSGKLIAQLRKNARGEAEKISAEIIISDGPPGIGCPVISSMSGVDQIVAVTEPTPSGLHDLKRLTLLARQFEIKVYVIINKWDLNKLLCEKTEEFCKENSFTLLGKISYDPLFAQLLKEGKTVLSKPDTLPAEEIKEIWKKLQSEIM